MDEIIYPKEKKDLFLSLFEKNLTKLENLFNLSISRRGNKIMFDGNKAMKKEFKEYLSNLLLTIDEKSDFNGNDFNLSISMVKEGRTAFISKELKETNKIVINGKTVYPKTFNQKKYIKASMENDLTFSLGPAGTGKTFLAIAIALHYLLSKKVDRIVLTRPVVEAGEKLGFLPGDIQQKINPYLRPLYDSLYYLIGFERTMDLISKEIIEIAPLAYMRGRTINNAFIILDEGQNTLNSQMQMFLTRFGENSRVIVTADLSQIDIPNPEKSGIFRAIKILENINGIKIIRLNDKDVVRHKLVQEIIRAYEKVEKK